MRKRRSQIIRELSNLSRYGWQNAHPEDYRPLEAELARLASASSVECPHCHWGFAPTVIKQHIREKH